MTRLLLVLSVLIFASFSAAQVFTASYPPLPADTSLERDLLMLTDIERQRNGLGTLEHDDALALAARHHAQEMAELNYFSHSSPTPENATLGRRVAQAGSAARTVGENLALVGPADAARSSVQGWMESPGHRANLLEPSFTHVGFGTAQSADGRVYVAQVFAAQPLAIERATLTSRLQNAYRVEVVLTLTEAKEVALFYGSTSLPLETLAAGQHVLAFTLEDEAPVHLRVGVRDAGASGGFILHDDGWLGADGRWQASGSAPRTLAAIERVSRTLQVDRVYRAEFTFASVPEGMGAWLEGEYLEPTISGRTLYVNVPSTAAAPTLDLGMETEAGRYTLLYSLQLELSGAPRLRPTALN